MDCINEVVQVVYNEARGSIDNMRAVAHVIYNRSKETGKSICTVVRTPNQFATKRTKVKEPIQWRLATRIVLDPGPDLTRGATFFHNWTVRPSWSYRFKVTYRVAGHTFYSTK